VKRTTDLPRVAEVDYSVARAQAISWLGDRYLLARPINAKHHTGGKISPAVCQSARINDVYAGMPRTRPSGSA
jgi:hypothetical protein